MNRSEIEAQMQYHARQYRKAKQLLVGDAANLKHYEKMLTVWEKQAEQTKKVLESYMQKYRDTVKQKRSITGNIRKLLLQIEAARDASENATEKQALNNLVKRATDLWHQSADYHLKL